MTSVISFYLSTVLYFSTHYCGKASARVRWMLKTSIMFCGIGLAFTSPSAHAQAWAAGRPYMLEYSSEVPRIAIADFDGDGIRDVAVVVSGKLQVLKGDGRDGFAPFGPQLIFRGNSVIDVAVGDFNGDGKSDMIVIGTDSTGSEPRLYLLAGKGNGQFDQEIPLENTGAPALDSFSRLAAGCFTAQQTGGARIDLAITSRSSPRSVLILTNDAQGGFSLGPTIEAVEDGRTITGISTVSVSGSANLAIESTSNKDGLSRTDLVLNSHGSFTPHDEAMSTSDLAIFADYDGDAIPDRISVLAQSSGSTLVAQRGNTQAFGAPRSVAEWPRCRIQALVAGDVSDYPGSQALNLIAVRDCPSTSPGTAELSLIGVWNTAQTNVEAFASERTLTPGTVSIDVVVTAFDGEGVPSGNIGVSVNGAPMQVSSLVAGVGHVTANLDQGVYSIQSVYGGSDDYAVSTRRQSLTLPLFAKAASSPVGPRQASQVLRSSSATTLTLTSEGSAVSSAPSGSVVTLTAEVTVSGSLMQSGLVDFCDAMVTSCTDIHHLGAAQLTSAGTAVFKFVPGIGNHSYRAVFSGDSRSAASSSTASAFTVSGKHPTKTTIAQEGYPGNYSLTATVVGWGSLSASLVGTVSFLDTSYGNSLLATAALGSSIADLSFASYAIPVGIAPQFAATGDFNGDGRPDLAVANTGSGTVTVMLGKGDGTFTAAANLATGEYPGEIAIGDFNGDGNLDLAVANQLSDSVTVLLGRGDGTFTEAPSPRTGHNPSDIAVGDFNGDGKADLALSNQNSGWVTVLLGNGDGSFSAAPSPVAAPSSESVTVGDFNGDGKADLVVVTSAGKALIMLGDGDGTFTEMQGPLLGPDAGDVVIGDFNGDGKADFAVSDEGCDCLTVALGNGDGTFILAPSPATGEDPHSLDVGDFNGDGLADLAVANGRENTVTILLGNGDGTFTPAAANPATGNFPVNALVGDFDGDGISDLIISNFSGGTASVMLTKLTKTVTATATGISPLGEGIHQVEATYPGDDSFESSVSATTGLVGNKVTPLLNLTTSLSPSSYGRSITFTCAAAADGRPVINGTALAFSVDGQSVSSETTTNGIATWTTSLLPAGTYDIGCATGDVNYNQSTKAIVQVVNKATAVSIVVVSSESPSTFAENVTLRINVAGTSATPTGTVTLSYNATVLGTSTLNGSGLAIYSTAALPVGADALTVTYNGDSNYK